MSLENQTALITGASRGIGRAIALNLARRGVHLALVARNGDDLHHVGDECAERGVKAVVLPYDLSDLSNTQKVVRGAVDKLGSLSFLINNAGLYEGGPTADADLAAWDRVIALNVQSVVHMTRHALPHIARAKGGAVVNIASISGKQSHKGGAIYCASKHAVVGFTQALFEDVREQGIKVCAICPGYVDTDMVRHAHLDMKKTIAANDVAEAVAYVLSQSERVCPTEIVLRPQRAP